VGHDRRQVFVQEPAVQGRQGDGKEGPGEREQPLFSCHPFGHAPVSSLTSMAFVSLRKSAALVMAAEKVCLPMATKRRSR
jgi:hypothetical protein